jgi:hypothetical protein
VFDRVQECIYNIYKASCSSVGTLLYMRSVPHRPKSDCSGKARKQLYSKLQTHPLVREGATRPRLPTRLYGVVPSYITVSLWPDHLLAYVNRHAHLQVGIASSSLKYISISLRSSEKLPNLFMFQGILVTLTTWHPLSANVGTNFTD